jgi:hypothetical protein
MVDSIVFRIEDLRAHEKLVSFLHQNHVHGQANFVKDIPTQVEEREIDGKMFYHVSDSDFIKRSYVHKYWTDFATGKTFESSYRAHLPSYHYQVAYSINTDKDFIEFNFSIPKYLYRTNVFQFVPHFFDKDYSLVYDNTISERGKSTYKRLKRFIKWFVMDKLHDYVDWYSFKFDRVDLAFNKCFRSKEEALGYLSDLKQIKKKYIRLNTLRIGNYQAGLYFAMEDYTFKIYHKGTEFATHDKKELKKQIAPYQVDIIQDFADKMIRYEVEYRPAMMDRLFKRSVFRTGSPHWKKARRYYNQFMRSGYIIVGGKKRYVTPPVQDRNGYEYSSQEIRDMKMTRTERALLKYGKFYQNKVFHFYMRSPSKLAEDHPFWDAEIQEGHFSWERQQRFSQPLFDSMVRFFLVLYREFSVSYQDDLRSIIGNIEDKNDLDTDRSVAFRDKLRSMTQLKESDISKISASKLKMFLSLLRSYSFSQIKAERFFSDSTFYRYQRIFKALGYTDFSTSQLHPLADDTFTTYMFWLEDVNSKLNFENLFKTKF